MDILPQITPASTKVRIAPDRFVQNPVGWMGQAVKKEHRSEEADVSFLTSPESVHRTFSAVEPDTLVALVKLDSRRIRADIGERRYILNIGLPRMQGLNLVQYPLRYVVEDAYADSALLARLGLDSYVDSLSLIRKIVSKFRQVSQKSPYGEISLQEEFKRYAGSIGKAEAEWYRLNCAARPFLTGIPPFRVDTEIYDRIADSWRGNPSRQGKVTSWERVRQDFGEQMPVFLTPEGADTGRFITKHPSLHAMPSELRSALFAREGHVLISCDYHQMQPRMVAEVSGDEAFRSIFTEGRDLYKVWASIFYGKSEDEVTSSERRVFKTISLAWLYGMTEEKLAATIVSKSEELGAETKISEHQAKAGLQSFNKQFERLVAWKKELAQHAKRYGYVSTHFGRRISLSEEYTAACYWAQGTEVQLMLHLITALGRKLKSESPDVVIKFFMHDELILEAPEAGADRASSLLSRAMEKAFLWRFPQAPTRGLLDSHVAESWGNLK